MIHAELKGKLGSDYSRAHERAEDLLTSTVFGLLSYLPAESGLVSVLRQSTPISCASLFDDSLDRVVNFRISYWPWLASHSQPDLLVELLTSEGAVIHLVLIEAKLHSSKGIGAESEDEEPEDESLPRLHPDQLVKYWNCLEKCACAGCPTRTLIYLTADPIAPECELNESLEQCPAMRVGWLSWRDIWRVAWALRMESRIANDLADVLEFRGLNDFVGFRSTPILLPEFRSTWSRKWFAIPFDLQVPGASFWSRDEQQ